MTTRRYSRSSIEELERQFASSKDDRIMLNELGGELERRNTNRAKALAKKVAEQLAVIGQPKSAEKLARAQQLAPIARAPEGPSAAPRTPSSTTNSPQFQSNGSSASNSSPPPTVDHERNTPAKHSKSVTPLDFEDATPQFAPAMEVKPGPDSVLAAWLTLEVLAPQALPDARELETIERTLVALEEYPEPWKEPRFWRRGKERAVHWMVYLGELDLAKATEAILKIYPDDAADERSDVRGNTTLAVMVLDSHGRPVEDKTFLSSFAWG